MLITIYWAIHSGHINHHRHRHRNGTKNLFQQFSLLSILFLLTSGPIIIDCNQWNHNNNNSQYNNDGEYSIANFLPSFTKSLLFWRQSDSSANISQKSVNPTPIITREIPHSPVITSAALIDDSLSPYNNQSMMMINTYPSTTTILPDLNRNRQCFSCQNNGDYMYQDSNEEYRQRIEFIKEQILNKLGLKEPPKLPNQPDIDLINMYARIVGQLSTSAKRNADYTEHDEEMKKNQANSKDLDDQDLQIVYILPKHYHYYQLKSPIFDLQSIIQQSSNDNLMIKSIIILVKYKISDQSLSSPLLDLSISSVSGLIELKRNAVLHSSANKNVDDNFDLITIASPTSRLMAETTTEQQNEEQSSTMTYEYDVTNLLLLNNSQNDENDNGDNRRLDGGQNVSNGRLSSSSSSPLDMIRIYNENFEIQSSFIKIAMTNVNNNKLLRAKRSVDCTDKVSFCCRQPFYVNFTTIGWNNWILQPPGYNANYCKGQCDVSHARYHHTTVIGKYPIIKLCCSPREMSSISLIYVDNDYNIYQKNLPNMVVKSCDCA
ncbi:uncharacterized protein LOC124500482 isoform X1 [Dermatophagoides farinae]|uniref:uncharacterized protein LOC124500482 isoform X1 n=1 Tax=Dermatophagoides farinae TaxID=6954 RepID=UPI003F5FE642